MTDMARLRATVREQRQAMRLYQLGAEARANSRLLESYEYYDRLVDYPDRLTTADRLIGPAGTLQDRRDGQRGPLIRTLYDLETVRGFARVLYELNPPAQGIVGNLTDYIVGTGYPLNATAKAKGRLAQKESAGLCAQVQAVWDEFDEREEFGERQREIFEWSVVDGEYPLRHFDEDGYTSARKIEPEQLRVPPGESEIGEWSMGARNAPHDVERIVELYSVYKDTDDGADGISGEYVPIEEVTIFKRNAPRNVKRGLSDFFPVREDLESVRKLVRNLAVTGAVQAAIAWVRQFDSAQRPTVEAMRTANSDFSRQDPGTGREVFFQRVVPGQQLDMPKGMAMFGAPQATFNTAGHISIVQAALRHALVKWRAPEFFTGDASNNNFASILVAGSPFVLYGTAQQEYYRRRFLRTARIVVENAVRAGRLPPEALTLVKLAMTPPAIAIQDPLKDEQVRAIRNASGVLSVQTWRAQANLDDEAEQANITEQHERDPLGGGKPLGMDDGGDLGDPNGIAPNAGGADAAAGLRATVGGSSAVAQLQRSYYAGELPREAAVANARIVFGFDQAAAAALFPEKAPVKLTPDGAEPKAGGKLPGMQESLVESDGPHKFASTQIDLPEPLASRVRALASSIPDDDLAGDGREDRPHVTVKYGLHADDPAGVAAVVRGFGPVRVRLGVTSLFAAKSDDGEDVLKFDVNSDDLHRLNAAVAGGCENTEKYPEYCPHVTVAYLKPGCGRKYVGDSMLFGEEFTGEAVRFSDREGNVTAIQLVESLREVKDASGHDHAADGKFGTGSGSAAGKVKAVATKAWGKFKDTLKGQFDELSNFYGRPAAFAIVGVAALPLPGTAAAPLAAKLIAKAVTHLRGGAVKEADEGLGQFDDAELGELVRNLWQAACEATGEDCPELSDDDIKAAMAKSRETLREERSTPKDDKRAITINLAMPPQVATPVPAIHVTTPDVRVENHPPSVTVHAGDPTPAKPPGERTITFEYDAEGNPTAGIVLEDGEEVQRIDLILGADGNPTGATITEG